jgi:hypothetical protein
MGGDWVFNPVFANGLSNEFGHCAARQNRKAMKTAKSIFGIFTIMTVLASGCSKTDAPAATSNNAVQQEPKPVQSTGESATTNADDATKKETALLEEAGKLAANCALEHWAIQQDGALWYGHVDQNDLLNPELISQDVQFKPVTPNLVTAEMSEADRLNGVEWRGAVNFSATAGRVRQNDLSWTDWQSYKYGTFWSVRLEKRNGNWTVNEQVIEVGRGSLLSNDGDVMTLSWKSLKSQKPTTAEK